MRRVPSWVGIFTPVSAILNVIEGLRGAQLGRSTEVADALIARRRGVERKGEGGEWRGSVERRRGLFDGEAAVHELAHSVW